MKLEVRKIGEVTIVDVKENIINELGPEFREQMDGIISDKNIKEMVLNFEEVDYLCSTGFGVVAAALREMRRRKGDLKLLHLGDKVRKLFEISRLTKIVNVFDNEDEALRAV